MIKFEKRLVINCRQETAFDFITNLTNDSQWQTGVQSVTQKTDGPIREGTTWRYVTNFMGREIEAEVECTGYNVPDVATFKTLSGPIPFENIVEFSPDAEGTLITIKGQAEIEGFFKLAEGLVSKQLTKQIDKDTETLRLLLEAAW